MIEDDKEVIEGQTENVLKKVDKRKWTKENGQKKVDKRKWTNRQTMINKTPHRKLKIEQQKESYRKQKIGSGACPGTVSSINRP